MVAEILFRCDASPLIGAGHVMRCLAAAKVFSWAGWTCRFSVNRDALATVPALGESGHAIDVVETNQFIPVLSRTTRIAVVDHYQLDEKFECALKSDARRIVVFDDLANRRHQCDILLDPTPGRTSSDYSSQTSEATELLLGPDHAIIDRRWLEVASTSRRRLAASTSVNRILVSMGATDPVDATSRVLDALETAQITAHIDVVLGAGAPYLDNVAARMTQKITLHVNPADLPALASRADLAIGAPGTSSFERALLGLPTIMLQIADNQTLIAAALAQAGAALVLPSEILDNRDRFAPIVVSLAGDAKARAAMSKAASRLTDGRGAFRLLVALSGREQNKAGRQVKLRLANERDRDWLLDLQKQPQTRRFANSPNIPTEEEHAAWFTSILNDSDRLLMIVEADGSAAGMVRIDRTAETTPSFVLSIAIDGANQGAGTGFAALSLVRRMIPSPDIVANVLPDNKASLGLFASAGYVPDGGNRYRNHAV